MAEQGTHLASQEKDLDRQLRATGESLEAAGFGPRERALPQALLAALASEVKTLEKARGERERLEGERRKLEGAAGRLDAEVAAAGAQLEAAKKRVTELDVRARQLGVEKEGAERELCTLAKAQAWDLGPDEERSLEDLQRVLLKEHGDAAATAGRLETAVARLEKDIALAAQHAQRKAELEAKAALAHTLAQHLRADQLLAYVQEEALRLLAEDGSRHLEALSLGRYSLVAQEQEFAVVDHWNADGQRSVKTLSGGETFLASLSLALALAEGLAGLAVEGRAGEALESLFLDEGFGTLDPETLGQVVQALDALHGGRRLVGVVTHIPELAAQLPARVEVERAGGTARIRVS